MAGKAPDNLPEWHSVKEEWSRRLAGKRQAMKTSEDEHDVANVEAWADVFRDLLYLIPGERRAEVLAFVVTKNHEAERAKAKARAESRTLHPFTLSEYVPDPNWDTAMRLRSLVIQV